MHYLQALEYQVRLAFLSRQGGNISVKLINLWLLLLVWPSSQVNQHPLPILSL
jgi:hypothetical protein